MDCVNLCSGHLIEKYGVRYAIRNFKLSDDIIQKILNNEFSCLYEEMDISKEEIETFQKLLN